MISETTAWVVFPQSTPTGLLRYSNANMLSLIYVYANLICVFIR